MTPDVEAKLAQMNLSNEVVRKVKEQMAASKKRCQELREKLKQVKIHITIKSRNSIDYKEAQWS